MQLLSCAEGQLLLPLPEEEPFGVTRESLPKVLVITSKMPRQRPSFPHTPASSRTSRIAVTLGSSSGSTPPPGTIQWSGRRDDVTSSTCIAYTQAMQHWHGNPQSTQHTGVANRQTTVAVVNSAVIIAIIKMCLCPKVLGYDGHQINLHALYTSVAEGA